MASIHKRTKAQIERDRVIITKWMCEGKSLPWICANLQQETKAEYSLSYSQIYKDYLSIINAYHGKRDDTLDAHIDEIDAMKIKSFNTFEKLLEQDKAHAFRYLEIVAGLLKEKGKLLGFHHDEPKLPDTNLNVTITFED